MKFTKISTSQFFKTLEFVWSITLAQIKSRYRNTFAGFIWVVLNPMLTFVVQAIIFKNILKIELQNYYIFLMSGIIPWIFLTNSISMSTNVIISNRQVLMSFTVSPWIFVLAQVFDNFINFLAAYLFLIGIFTPSLLLSINFLISLIFVSVIFFCFVFFLCYILSVINVFFRDTQFVVSFAINLAYFVTPVFYPKSLLPLHLHYLIDLNIFYYAILPFQIIFNNANLTSLSMPIFHATLLTLLLFIVSQLMWKKLKYKLYDRI